MNEKNGHISFARMKSSFFLGLIIFLGIIVLYIFRPFAYPIFWAAIIAITFYPVYLWIEKYIKIPSVSSLITSILVIVLVFIPITLLAFLLVSETAGLYERISSGNYFGTVQTTVTGRLQESVLAPVLETIKKEWETYAASGAKALGVFVFNNIRDITENSIKFVFMSFITIYTLFFFLKDGKRLLSRLMHLSPLGDEYEAMLYKRFTSTAKATLKGTLIIGAVQGTLGGILFAITGVEGAFVWAVVMTILSIIPAVGSFLVWMPAGVIMLIAGNVWQGLTILIVGAVLISNIDNVLRPPLIGKDTQMHPLLVLFSTLGGIFLFGVSGFIIGPVLMSLFLAVMSLYDHYYKNQLDHN